MAEKGVVIRPSFCEAMRGLQKKDQLALFWAICDYGIYGTEPKDLSRLAGAIFTIIQPTLESADRRYEASVANGKKGGAPKGNKNAKKKRPAVEMENNPAEQPTGDEKQPGNNPNIDITTAIDTDIDKAITKEPLI